MSQLANEGQVILSKRKSTWACPGHALLFLTSAGLIASDLRRLPPLFRTPTHSQYDSSENRLCAVQP